MPPVPMLATAFSAWPGGEGWVLEPKWDGFRLLVSVDRRGRVRAWSRRGASLTQHLGGLLEPVSGATRESVFDTELIALSAQNGSVGQDFAAVCRTALQGSTPDGAQLQLVAFDLLELAGDDVRELPWRRRTACLRDAFPTGDRLRVVQAFPARRAVHDQLVDLGFEGSMLKRPGSTYRPGRQSAWRKFKASHRVTATLHDLRAGRDGHTYAICDVDGRRVTVPGSQRLRPLIGAELELAYSRLDADGSLREVRISSPAPRGADARDRASTD